MTRDEIPPRTLNIRPIPFSQLHEHMLSLLPLLRTYRSSQPTLPHPSSESPGVWICEGRSHEVGLMFCRILHAC
jgi:hypothetical protein